MEDLGSSCTLSSTTDALTRCYGYPYHVGMETNSTVTGGLAAPTRGDGGGVEAKLDEVLALLRQGAATPGEGRAAPDRFWALEGLRARAEEGPGQVLMVGTVTLPTGVPYEWQLGAEVGDLLDTPWDELAPAVDALAHPVRLRLVREVVHGRRTTAELAALEGLGTSGQLHHHLRQLVAAGWLRSAERGSYEVPAARVVPLLVLLLAAQR